MLIPNLTLNGILPKSLLIALTLFYVSVAQAEVFVSTTGNDETADGTIEKPFLTPQAAVAAANPLGDTVTFRGGTYPISKYVRIDKPNITLRSHPGEWAVLEGPSDNEDLAFILWFREKSTGSKVQRLEIAGGYYYGIKFENIGWSQAVSEHIDRNYVVEDSVLRDSGRDLIKISPGIDNIVIRRNHFARSGQRYAGNADGIDNVNSNNFVVQDNFFEDIATAVLYAKGGAKNAIIERNISINSGNGFLLGFSTDNEFFDKDNIDKNGRSIYENIDGIVRNNIVINSKGAGIGIFAANRPQVYNNTLINTATETFASIAIEPNIDPYASHGTSRDVTIRNNIVVQAADAENPAVRIRCHRAVSPCVPGFKGYLKMSNNLYYKGGAEPVFEDQRPESKFRGDLTGWQAHIESDTDSMVGDPNLNEHYHLAAESIAIDAGYDIATIIDDYDGMPRTNRFDIGADEFGSLYLPVLPQGGTVGTGATSTDPDQVAPTMGEIEVVKLTSKSATISWSTHELASSEIMFGETADFGQQMSSTTIPSHKHSFVLTDLAPETSYHYQVKSTDYFGNTSVSEARSFTTPEIIYTTISANVEGEGGSILPAGTTTLVHGDSQQYQITVQKGYNIAQVIVDGVDQGVVENYEFNEVDAEHSITVKFAAIPTTEQALPANPLLYYTFDEADDNVVADLSGNNHDGVLSNGARLGYGLGGQALLLDGDNDYMTIADADELNIYHSFTVGAWIKRERLMIGESIYDAGSNHSWGVKMRGGSHAFEYRVKTKRYSNTGLEPGLGDKNWHHVLMVKTGDLSEFYIDGRLVRSMASPEDGEVPTGVKKIGAETIYGKEAFSPFQGRIDNFVFYDRALTAEEAYLVYEKTGLTQEEIGTELPADPEPTPEDPNTDDGGTNTQPDDSGSNNDDPSVTTTALTTAVQGVKGVYPAPASVDVDHETAEVIIEFVKPTRFQYTDNHFLRVIDVDDDRKEIFKVDPPVGDPQEGKTYFQASLAGLLKPDTNYEVIADRRVALLTGTPYSVEAIGPGLWTFKTAAIQDTNTGTAITPLNEEVASIIGVSPAPGSTNIDPDNVSIVLQYNGVADYTWTDRKVLYIHDLDTGERVFTIDPDKTDPQQGVDSFTVNLEPGVLRKNSRYGVTVDRMFAVVSKSPWKTGAIVEGQWTFETVAGEDDGYLPPVLATPVDAIIGVHPAPGSTDLDPDNVSIVVQYDGVADYTWTGNKALYIHDLDTGERVFKIDPDKTHSQQGESSFTVAIDPGVLRKNSRYGVTADRMFAVVSKSPWKTGAITEGQWTFETVAGEDDGYLAPVLATPVDTIIGVHPAPGSVDIDPDSASLTLEFSAATDYTWTHQKALYIHDLDTGDQVFLFDPDNTHPQQGEEEITIDIPAGVLKGDTNYGVTTDRAFAVVHKSPWKSGVIAEGQWTFSTLSGTGTGTGTGTISLSAFHYLDEDGDGISVDVDICPYAYNPEQEDINNNGICDYDEVQIEENGPVVDLRALHVSPYGAWFSFTSPKAVRSYQRYVFMYSTNEADLTDPNWIAQQYENDDYIEFRTHQLYGSTVPEQVVMGLEPDTVYYITAIEKAWYGLVEGTSPSIVKFKTQSVPDFTASVDSHPRVTTNQTEVEALKQAYFSGNSAVVEAVNRLSQMGQEAINGNKSYKPGMVNALFAYQISGNPQDLENGKYLLALYRDFFQQHRDQGMGGNQFRNNGFIYLVALDLAWNALTREEKEYYLAPYVDVITKSHAIDGRLGNTDETASGARSYVAFGLLVGDEFDGTPIGDAAKRMMDIGIRHFYGYEMVKMKKSFGRHAMSGGLPDDGSRYGFNTNPYRLETMLALRNAGFDDADFTEIARQMAKSSIFHAATPSGMGVVAFNDVENALQTSEEDSASVDDRTINVYIHTLGLLKGTADAAYLKNYALNSERYQDVRSRFEYGSKIFSEFNYLFVLHELLEQQQDHAQAYPTHFFDGGMGFFFDRTSWEKDASLLVTHNGWRYVHHMQNDEGGIQFYRKGTWLLHRNVGYDGLSGHCAANATICLQQQSFFETSELPEDDVLYSSFMPERNNNRIDVNPSYDFIQMGMTNVNSLEYEAFKGKNYNNVERNVVWFKGGSDKADHMVVYDYVDTLPEYASLKKGINFVFRYQPTLDGNVTSMTRSGQELAIISQLSGDKTLSIIDPPVVEDGDKIQDYTYNLEVAPNSDNTQDHFLHTLVAFDEGSINVEGGYAEEVFAKDSAQNVNAVGSFINKAMLALFSYETNELSNTQYQLQSTGAVEHVISGLIPDMSYRVSANNADLGTFTASENGVISYGTDVVGGLTVEVSLVTQ